MLDDLWPRLLVSPALGIGIALASGVVTPSRYGGWQMVGHCVYFSASSFLVWEGNRRLSFRARRRFSWFEHPWRRIGLILATIGLYTVPALTSLLLAWRAVTHDPGATPRAITIAVAAAVLAVVLITHVYETIFVLREWDSARLRSERLERARLQAELDALHREIDPHFLFNGLNSLAHLIESSPDKALEFVETLAASYRYLLDTRHRRFVRLEEELRSLMRFRTLASLRFGSAVRLDVSVSPHTAHAWQLPPLSLQELLENALKHNWFDAANPLDLRVGQDGAVLVVSNVLRPRPVAHSTGVGLANLDNLLRLSTGRGLERRVSGDRFEVRVPLMPSADSLAGLAEAGVEPRSPIPAGG